MLKTQFKQNLQKRIKSSLFNTQMQLMSNRLQLPFLITVLLQILSFWLNISIFFISNPLQPQIINQIFYFPLIPSISQHTGIAINVFKIFFIIDALLVVGLTLVHLRSMMLSNVLTKVLNFLVFQNQLLLVLKTHLMITALQAITEDSTTLSDAINIAYSIILLISIGITAVFTYFKVKPFRKKSLFWSFDNNKQFLTFVMNFLRVLIIMIDGRSVSFLIVSFLVELILRKLSHRFFTKENQKIQAFGSNMNMSAHVALLVYDFTSSAQLASQILAFLLLVSIINALLSCYSIINEERYFPLCNAAIYEYYDFYCHFVEKKIKGNSRQKLVKKDSQSDKILTIHLLNCQQRNCMIRNVKFSQQSYCEDLQNLCNNVMKTRFNQNKQNELIYELWKFQTGNKFKFRMQQKHLDILHEYIIYCALNLGRMNQKSDQVNQQNIKSLKGVFYQKLQNILQCFSLFYEEITKTQPKLDTILTLGNDIKTRTSDLKTLYSDLLKHSVINFKTAEVYVQFQNFFLKENNVTQESIDRLRKIQKSKQSDHIQQIYLPALTAYSETGLIENMNTQCLSFFRLTRFEMKSKNINSLLYPQVQSLKEIKQKLKNNKNQKLFTFFRRRDEIVFGSILVKQKYIDNKKFDVILIEKNPYSDYRNVFLLNKDTFEIEVIEKEETFIRPSVNNSTQIVLKWRHLFNVYLKPVMNTLVQQKVVKTRIPQVENSLFVMNIQQTIQSQYLIINTKVIKDMQKKRNRVSSFMFNKPQPNNNQREHKCFRFYYNLQDRDEVCLFGVNSNQFGFSQSLKKTTSLGEFQREMSNLVVANTLLLQNRFSKGIKTYRLHRGQLYNIDLQDKQKYIQQFDDQISLHKQQSMFSGNQIDLYLITGIFFTLLVLIGLSVVYNIFASNSHQDVVWNYTNGFRVQQLRLQMNRMCAITRDYQQGLYRNTTKDYKIQLLDAYNKLKLLRYQSLLFNSQQITVSYRNINYAGTLNEIIDVMVSHIYQMTLTNANLTEINYFHDSYIATVNPKVIQQKVKLLSNIQAISENIDKLQQITLIIGITCIFVFYLLLGGLIAVMNTSAKDKLKNLMMMSDNQARTNQTMAEKLKYAVQMIKKNFDIDLKALLGPKETHKQRKRPKQPIIGAQKKLITFVGLLIGFAVHLFIFYLFASEISQILVRIKTYSSQGGSFLDTYSMFTQQTNKINHFNVYDIEVIRNLRYRLNQLAVNRMNYNFDDRTNKLIDMIFFEDSCQKLYDMGIFQGENVVCGKFLPNYLVSNPLQMGFVAYFSRVHYYMLDNITQTYGVTGIYSGPFVTLFSTLSTRISEYGVIYIEDSFSQLLVYNIIYIIISVVYIGVTLTVIYFLKRMNKQINQLLGFLNYSTNISTQHDNKKQKNKAKHDQSQKDKTSNKQKGVSISSISDDKIPSSDNSISEMEGRNNKK